MNTCSWLVILLSLPLFCTSSDLTPEGAKQKVKVNRQDFLQTASSCESAEQELPSTCKKNNTATTDNPNPTEEVTTSPTDTKLAHSNSDNNDEDGDFLKLTLDKPFGLLLDPDIEDEAIVSSLDDERPGSVHKLSKQVQEQLIGSQIVSVNGQEVWKLSLEEVVERLVASNSPVTLEFELDEDEDDEDDEDDDDDDGPPTIDYYDDILVEPIQPGEISFLKWKDNHDIIDPYAARIGLPPQLVPTIQAYAKRLKIIEGLKDVLYNNPCEPEDGRYYNTDNPHIANTELPFLHHEKLNWYAQRPASHWHSDMHWFAGSDERTHESMLRMLFEGGFDQVLDVIGTQFDLDNLFIQSVGFLGVSHCEEGFLHHDFKEVDGKFFNFLIPVALPENTGPELNAAGKRNVKWSPTRGKTVKTPIVGTEVKYDPAFGVLQGDGSLHGTREVDLRPQGEIRVVLSIYLADINQDNIHEISSDVTAIFPVPKVQEYLWSQKGRHWRRDMCMNPDIGRQAFPAVDHSNRCVKVAKDGKCESVPEQARKLCPQSCEVYMEDWEYRPGVERSAIMGDFDFVV